MEIVLSELENCIPDISGVETAMDEAHLVAVINNFLRAQHKTKRNLFVQRYWYMYPVREIAEMHDMSESKVKAILYRMRVDLKKISKRRKSTYEEGKLLNAIGQIDDKMIADASPRSGQNKNE